MTYPWAAGEVLTAADLNAYAGLVFITEASATSGTALSVNGCFSTQFRNYRLVVSTYQTVIASNLQMRLRVGGADTSTNVYYSSRQRVYYNAAATSVDAGSGISTFWMPCLSESNRLSAGTVDVYNPNSLAISGFSGHGYDSRTTASSGAQLMAAGHIDATTQYDGFTLISTQTITNLTVRVYGHNNG